jgi:N utilization substance protein B
MAGAAPRADSRHRAREAALQLLYAWEIGRLELAPAAEAFWECQAPKLTARHRAFANALASGVVDHLAELDRLIAETAAHWRFERLTVVDRLILRLGVYELLHRPDTPPGVVINEALELARTFSTEEAVGFVNGNLDAIARGLASRTTPAEI